MKPESSLSNGGTSVSRAADRMHPGADLGSRASHVLLTRGAFRTGTPNRKTHTRAHNPARLWQPAATQISMRHHLYRLKSRFAVLARAARSLLMNGTRMRGESSPLRALCIALWVCIVLHCGRLSQPWNLSMTVEY